MNPSFDPNRNAEAAPQGDAHKIDSYFNLSEYNLDVEFSPNKAQAILEQCFVLTAKVHADFLKNLDCLLDFDKSFHLDGIDTMRFSLDVLYEKLGPELFGEELTRDYRAEILQAPMSRLLVLRDVLQACLPKGPELEEQLQKVSWRHSLALRRDVLLRFKLMHVDKKRDLINEALKELHAPRDAIYTAIDVLTNSLDKIDDEAQLRVSIDLIGRLSEATSFMYYLCFAELYLKLGLATATIFENLKKARQASQVFIGDSTHPLARKLLGRVADVLDGLDLSPNFS